MRAILILLIAMSHHGMSQNCNSISKEEDKFTNKITYRSPIFYNVTFTKVIVDSSTYNFIRLSTIGSTLNVMEKGVIVLFSDGSKFENNEKEISTHTDPNGWGYSVFITITPDELKMFSEKTITDFRLYIYDQSVGKNEAKKYMNWARCIMESE